MNIIAKKAVKGIPMSSAASVALRCATVLTVATSILILLLLIRTPCSYLLYYSPRIPNKLNQPIPVPMMIGKPTIVNAMITNAQIAPSL